jgi:hypothetical protein
MEQVEGLERVDQRRTIVNAPPTGAPNNIKDDER